jgi:transposase
MRFYSKGHEAYRGSDVPARTMSGWIVNRDGEILLHRKMPTAPEIFLRAIAPYRRDLVGAVECMFTWYWLADLCVQGGLTFGRGHAQYMKAIHGGKAKHDRPDARQTAVLLRGGVLPQACAYPAARRATRDSLRRRLHPVRPRAERLTHMRQANSQSKVPAVGRPLKSKAPREGVARRFSDPAVQKNLDVDLALIDSYDRLIRDLERRIMPAARQHGPQTRERLRSVPGIGPIPSLVLLCASHAMHRFPRAQECAPSWRVVKCAHEAAGKRDGPSGHSLGNGHLKWAFSEAAVLFPVDHPPGQKDSGRLAKKYGPGKALTVLAHTLARAVSYLLQRHTTFAMDTFMRGQGSDVGEPA